MILVMITWIVRAGFMAAKEGSVKTKKLFACVHFLSFLNLQSFKCLKQGGSQPFDTCVTPYKNCTPLRTLQSELFPFAYPQIKNSIQMSFFWVFYFYFVYPLWASYVPLGVRAPQVENRWFKCFQRVSPGWSCGSGSVNCLAGVTALKVLCRPAKSDDSFPLVVEDGRVSELVVGREVVVVVKPDDFGGRKADNFTAKKNFRTVFNLKVGKRFFESRNLGRNFFRQNLSDCQLCVAFGISC